MQLHVSILLTLAAAALAAPAVAGDTAPGDGAGNGARQTDFRGRPPFNRSAAPETADLARFEETAARPVERQSRFRGRPPFSRSAIEKPVDADLARFEEMQDTSKPRRRGPPGKMTTRR
jgi:hypothetical protein